MHKPDASRDALMPRPPRGMGPGLVIALAIHVLLVIALAIGVNWRSSEPAAVEAELWAAVPQTAAPKAAAPDPKPEPKPEPPPEPPPPPPPPKVTAPPRPSADAQIAIEKAKREAERREQQREEAERKEKELAKKRAEEKAEKERLAKEEAERERIEKAKAEEARKLAEKKQQEAEARRKKEEAERDKRLAEAREANLKRILGQAGASGGPGATGSAQHSAGPSAGYAGRIVARVRPNIVFTDSISGNPEAEVRITLSPDGRILSQRLTKSSGVKAWDDAVQRAIDRTEVLPRDTDGRVPSSMVLSFRPQM